MSSFGCAAADEMRQSAANAPIARRRDTTRHEASGRLRTAAGRDIRCEWRREQLPARLSSQAFARPALLCGATRSPPTSRSQPGCPMRSRHRSRHLPTSPSLRPLRTAKARAGIENMRSALSIERRSLRRMRSVPSRPPPSASACETRRASRAARRADVGGKRYAAARAKIKRAIALTTAARTDFGVPLSKDFTSFVVNQSLKNVVRLRGVLRPDRDSRHVRRGGRDRRREPRDGQRRRARQEAPRLQAAADHADEPVHDDRAERRVPRRLVRSQAGSSRARSTSRCARTSDSRSRSGRSSRAARSCS